MAGLQISVIMVVRNGARTIRQALDSVFRSNTPPVELLVVDGASDDRTRDIAAGYPTSRVIQQSGTGIAAAYNEAISLAKGDALAFISHDDIWIDGKLDVQSTFMEDHPNILFSVGLVEHFLDGDCPPAGFRAELLAEIRPGYMMETMFARKAAFEIVGGFDPTFSVSEDTDWFARARDLGVDSRLLPHVLVRKRVHSTNSSLNAPDINSLLLRALRGSLMRKRAAQK